MEKENAGFIPNSYSVALAENCGKAYLNGKVIPLDGSVFTWNKLKYHGLNGGETVRGTYLMAPAAWFFRMVSGRNVSEYGGVLYASECYGELSMHMARLLKDLLR